MVHEKKLLHEDEKRKERYDLIGTSAKVEVQREKYLTI